MLPLSVQEYVVSETNEMNELTRSFAHKKNKIEGEEGEHIGEGLIPDIYVQRAKSVVRCNVEKRG